MGRVTTGLVALGVLASFGCHDTIGPGQGGANFIIQDAVHGGGNAHFYWSSPIVADPGRGGDFDPTYQPMVQICEWTGSTCAATVAEFRTGAGNGDAIRVDVAGELYHVNWHTSHCRRDGCPLNPAKTYRIRVLVGGLEAGVADVDLMSRRSEVRSVNQATYVPVVNGTTLQIRFRLERGLTLVNASAPLPELRRAGQRYRHSGVKPGTGRDGSAVVEGRALIGADGTTVIELSTGTLDQPGIAGRGNFEKVQLKQIGTSGAPVYTLNFPDLSGGSWSHALHPLPRRSRLEVTAHVSGVDASRTSVVTVPLTVGRRPDLAITSLAAPSSTTAGVPTVISALVAEQNGDVGASGDCRLYVNETLADEAPAIWVDAGDEVACTFAHTFAQAGTYEVRVAIEHVTPADDDASNNTASGSVAVTLLDNITIHNTAQAAVTEHDHYRESFSYLLQYTRVDDPAYLDLEEGGWERETHGRSVAAQHAWTADNGTQGNEITFPLASVKVSQRSGDAVIADYTLTNVNATSTESWDYVDDGGRHWGHTTCYRAAAPSGHVGWLRICTDVTNDEPTGQPVQRGSRTYANVETLRGHVQYLGRVFYHRVFTPYEEDYGYDAPWLEEQIDGGSVSGLGAEMSWTMEVNGIRAGNGQAIVYDAQVGGSWTLTDSQTFGGNQECATTRTVIGMTVEESRQCYVQSGAYRALSVSRPLTP